MRRVSYTDHEGRLRVSMIPEEALDIEAEVGVPIGPPDLSGLKLPLEIEVRLNNELYHRGILDARDALRNRQEIVYALQAALKVDAERIFGMYLGRNLTNGAETPEKLSNSTLPNRRSR